MLSTKTNAIHIHIENGIQNKFFSSSSSFSRFSSFSASKLKLILLLCETSRVLLSICVLVWVSVDWFEGATDNDYDIYVLCVGKPLLSDVCEQPAERKSIVCHADAWQRSVGMRKRNTFKINKSVMEMSATEHNATPMCVCVCVWRECGRQKKKKIKYINKRNLYADKGDDDQEENEVKSLSALLKQPSTSSAWDESVTTGSEWMDKCVYTIERTK